MPDIRVVAVDDDPLVLEALANKLAKTEDIVLVGQAANGPEGLRLIEEVQPDVVVMDVRMPLMSGTTAAAAIKSLHPTMRVILLTNYDDAGLLNDAMNAGADGLLLKGDGMNAVVSALRATSDGTMVISPQPLRRAHEPAPAPTTHVRLSERERDVLTLLCRAHSNAEIAERLFLSESRVKAHVSRLMERFGVDSRLGLVVRAFELDLPESH